MTESNGSARLRAEATQHRAELADTVAELAAKTNVKARVQKRAADVAEQAKDAVSAVADEAKDAVSTAVGAVKDAGRAGVDQFSGPPAAVVRRPVPWALVGVVVVGAAVGWLVWRRRS